MLRLPLALALLASAAQAQTTGYYDDLAAELSDTYGLPAGTWTVGGDQATVWADRFAYGATAESVAPQGVPFAEAIRVTRASEGQVYDAALILTNRQPVAQGDALVAVFWVRRESAPEGGFARAPLEPTSAPFVAVAGLDVLPRGEWRRAVMSGVAARAFAPGELQWSFQVGAQVQTLDVGGVGVLNVGPGLDAAALPQENPSLDYDGREPGAAWRAAALARIDALRRSPVEVRVERPDGSPADGATVRVEMLRHAFGFGSAVRVPNLVGTGPGDAVYRARLADLDGQGHAFNVVTVENALKWPPWEAPWWPGGRDATLEWIDAFRARGARVRGHTLVWPDWLVLPGDLEANAADGVYLRDRVLAHIAEEAGILRGRIDAWDVVNEPTHTGQLTRALVAAGVYPDAQSALRAWSAAAREADPDARLVVNEYNVVSVGGTDRVTQDSLFGIAQDLRAQGLLEGVGIQAHMGALPTPPERVLAVLDRFGALDLDLAITEYDTRFGDEAVEGDYMRDILTAVYSHPQTTEFVTWGFWDGAHYEDNAPLFRADWSVKPAGQAFFDRVYRDWWTDASATADASGLATVAGAYHGTYRVEATLDGTTTADTLTVTDDARVTLRLPGATAASGQAVAEETRLLAVGPNPSDGRVTVEAVLAEPGPLRVVVFDALGRAVAVLADGVRGAGPVRLAWDGVGVAPGVYVVRLEVGSVRESRTVTVRR